MEDTYTEIARELRGFVYQLKKQNGTYAVVHYLVREDGYKLKVEITETNELFIPSSKRS